MPWTYVTGVIEVNSPGKDDTESEYLLKRAIDNLPVVTGEESDMVVSVAPDLSTNSLINYNDYERCKGPQTWAGCENYRSDRWLITVSGHLRYREYAYTLREVAHFLFRLSRKFYVENICVKVDSFSQQYIFANASVFQGAHDYENDNQSWRDDFHHNVALDDESNWMYCVDGADIVFVRRKDAEKYARANCIKNPKIKRIEIG